MTENKQGELLVIRSGDAFQPFNWSMGKYGSRFLRELSENKRIVGIRCGKCGTVYVPPRLVCGPCYAAMDEIVPLTGEGVINACTIVRFSFVDPATGVSRPVPYGAGFVKLDGADNSLPHFFDSADPQKVKVGARVRAVFEEERTGGIMDIKHFAIL